MITKLKVLRYMRESVRENNLWRDKERKQEQEEEGNQLFLFLFYIERFFLPIFFRSVRVLEKFSINTLTISFFFACCLLLCCYCPFPFYNISSLSPFIALHLPIYCIACVGLTDFNKMLSDWEKIYWKFSIG